MLKVKYSKNIVLLMLAMSFMTACHHKSEPHQEPKDLISITMPDGIEYGYVVTDRHGEIISEGNSPVITPLQVRKSYNLYCYSPLLQRKQIYIPVDLSQTTDFKCGGVTILGNNSRVTLTPQLSGLRILLPEGSSVASLVLKSTPSRSRFNLMSMKFEKFENLGDRKATVQDNEAFFALFPSNEGKYILDVVHNDGRIETITLNLLAKAGQIYATTLNVNPKGILEFTGFVIVDWSVFEHSFEFAYEDIQ